MRVHLVVVGRITVRRPSESRVMIDSLKGHLDLSVREGQALRDALNMADLGGSDYEE